MSAYIPMRVKQLFYQKAHGKNKKSIDSSSKSTHLAIKNILVLENKKLMDKVNYTDLYSDLIKSIPKMKMKKLQLTPFFLMINFF